MYTAVSRLVNLESHTEIFKSSGPHYPESRCRRRKSPLKC